MDRVEAQSGTVAAASGRAPSRPLTGLTYAGRRATSRRGDILQKGDVSHERILVIEDEGDLREVVAYNLSREGYRVSAAAGGRAGLERAEREQPDLIVLDLMLPDMDGLEVCRRIRRNPKIAATRIVMLTAKAEESDVVLGLGVGADDYLTKPFGVKELIARVQAVLRRGPTAEAADVAPQTISRGSVVVDPAKHDVRVNGESVHFTATEFRLLHFLASRPGRVFAREALLRHVMGDDDLLLDRNIDVHVRAIRQKLGDQRELIETVRGVGYRFQDESR